MLRYTFSQSLDLANALEKASAALETSGKYQWGHMGSCNCGFLAKEITGRSSEELHSLSMRKSGDWSDQLRDYCPSSGLPMDEIIERMEKAGLHVTSLISLERLSDEKILRRIPSDRKPLKYNSAKDAALYMLTWSKMIKEELVDRIELPLNLISSSEFENNKVLS
ncbi:MAG: hypothetical protein WED33_05380 [Bacteroidia bacterium]